MKSHIRQTGFTLLEVMIAAGVLVIALTGLLSTYTACFKLNETTRNSNLALNAAQEKLEEIRSATFLSIFDSYNGTSFSVSGMPVSDSLGYVSINNTNTSLLRVTIGVCWRDQDSKIIGECQDAAGSLVFVDTNGNGILDSPAEFMTEMAQR
jgi:prepilin-type N-terminal cleavage/methylation domain-containing protein